MPYMDAEDIIRSWKIFLNSLNTRVEQEKPLKNETIIDVDCEVKDINPPLIERRKDEEA